MQPPLGAVPWRLGGAQHLLHGPLGGGELWGRPHRRPVGHLQERRLPQGLPRAAPVRQQYDEECIPRPRVRGLQAHADQGAHGCVPLPRLAPRHRPLRRQGEALQSQAVPQERGGGHVAREPPSRADPPRATAVLLVLSAPPREVCRSRSARGRRAAGHPLPVPRQVPAKAGLLAGGRPPRCHRPAGVLLRPGMAGDPSHDPRPPHLAARQCVAARDGGPAGGGGAGGCGVCGESPGGEGDAGNPQELHYHSGAIQPGARGAGPDAHAPQPQPAGGGADGAARAAL
mmetsp:Transcript_35341/g.111678  ORF Transcript_35341/g.111678 Transcript_35341/m.111678 type:complete len:286 (+) Transcript_35341:337-1194(+)